MPAYANPFRRGYTLGFQPQTDAGRAMALSAAALLSGPTPNEIADREALAESRRAEAALRAAQTGKAESERAILEARRRLLEPEGMDETVAHLAGTTVPGVRAARDYTLGTPGVQTMPPAGPVLDAIRRASVALRTGAMDSTVDPLQIAKAHGEYGAQGQRGSVIDGTLDPTRVAQAHFATSGKAPFDNTTDGTMNVLTGAETINPVGEARVGHLNAQSGAQEALAAANRALAGERGARTTEITTLTPFRRALLESQAAAQTAQAGLRDTQADAGGFRRPAPGRDAAGRPAAVKPLSKSENEIMAATVSNLAGGKLDPQASARIMARATQLATDPNSEWHRNPAGAAEAAVSEIAPGGFKNTGIPLVPFTGTGRVPVHPGIAASKAGDAGPVPPAPQRVKDRVYNTPRGPMKWTGTGWIPADA